jgi:hypothetical protein
VEDASVGTIVPVAAPPASTTEPEPPTQALRFALGGALGMGFGAVPDPRPYLALDGALDHRYFLLRLAVRFDLPASDTRRIGGTVSAWRIGARLDACGGHTYVYGCLGLGARLYVAQGSDVDVARRDSSANFALTAQLLARYPLTRALALRSALGFDAPFAPASLELDGAGVFREAKISPFLEIGLMVWIP